MKINDYRETMKFNSVDVLINGFAFSYFMSVPRLNTHKSRKIL